MIRAAAGLMIRLSLTVLFACAQAWGALASVNTTTGSSTGSVSSLAAAAASHTTGNLLVVSVRLGNTVTVSSITDTAGNLSYTKATNNTNSSCGPNEIWYAKNITGNAANVVTAHLSGSSPFVAVFVRQYSGADPTSPLDQVATGDGTGGTVTSGTFTTTTADEVIFAHSCVGALGVTYTAGTGYGNVTQDANNMSAIEDKIVSSIQTGATASFTLSNGAGNSILVATFKAGSPPPPSAVMRHKTAVVR